CAAPSAAPMVGMAGATMVWSSAASNMDRRTPAMMTFFSRSERAGAAALGAALRLAVWSIDISISARRACRPATGAGRDGLSRVWLGPRWTEGSDSCGDRLIANPLTSPRTGALHLADGVSKVEAKPAPAAIRERAGGGIHTVNPENGGFRWFPADI